MLFQAQREDIGAQSYHAFHVKWVLATFVKLAMGVSFATFLWSISTTDNLSYDKQSYFTGKHAKVS